MYDHLTKTFVRINFIKDQNPDYWMTNVRRFFSRTKLLARDVKIIRGICHQVNLYGKGKIGYTETEEGDV
jgi:tRNA/rRNA methyltransferase